MLSLALVAVGVLLLVAAKKGWLNQNNKNILSKKEKQNERAK
jgi:hypothetical protein